MLHTQLSVAVRSFSQANRFFWANRGQQNESNKHNKIDHANLLASVAFLHIQQTRSNLSFHFGFLSTVVFGLQQHLREISVSLAAKCSTNCHKLARKFGLKTIIDVLTDAEKLCRTEGKS